MEADLWWSTTYGGLHVAFTSVRQGNLATHVGDPAQGLSNRRAIESQLGIPSGQLRFLHQVHSADVVDADIGAAGESMTDPTGDAWISETGTPLAVMVADCLPVLLAGTTPGSQVITAAAHAGRPGLLAGVLENTVSAMRDRGAVTVTAWIGPGACGQCYEIPEEMVDRLSADRPAIRSVTRTGHSALNLRAEAAVVLARAGAQLIDVPGCTIEDPELFSHRGSQQQGTEEGRLAGMIWPVAKPQEAP